MFQRLELLVDLVVVDVRDVAGGLAGSGHFVHQSVSFRSLRLLRRALAHRSRLGSGQRTDGQGDLVLLLVDGGDLRIDNVADGQDLIGLADAAVGDLGDVDQAIDARAAPRQTRRRA